MPTIRAWWETGAYKAKSGGGFEIVGAVKVVRSSLRPTGGETTQLAYIGKNSKDFNWTQQMLFRETNYYGLKQNATGDVFTQYRLWEVYDYNGAWAGMPQLKQGLDWNGRALFAGYWAGEYADSQIIESQGIPKLPVFVEYGKRNASQYNEILDINELKKYPLSSTTTTPSGGSSGSPGGSAPPRIIPPIKKPPPSTSGKRYGSADAMERRIGSGTSTSVTTGNKNTVTTPGFHPSFYGIPTDIRDPHAYTPKSPSKPPSGGKDKGAGGQWVTGADGKKYFLPGGIDFEGLKREYDRTHPKPETKIVVRMPKGYASPKTTLGDKPRMTQVQLDLTESGRAIGEVRDTFVFPYIPQNIRYADIGSEWQEIPRALNAPFVDWARYKLMKVSMDFLVAAQFRPGGDGTTSQVSDGLMNSVTNELNMLRRMAANKFPVYLEGFDDILQVQMARSRFETPRGMQFVINDLSITAARRTIDEKTGIATYPSNIAAAQVSLTLQEIPVETVTLVKLPPLDLGTPLVGKPGSGGGGIPSLGLQSTALTGLTWEIQ